MWFLLGDRKALLTPISKSSTADKRDPLSYRGIKVTSSLYKLYCVILNNRLVKWEQEYSVLNDAQTDFVLGEAQLTILAHLHLS